MLLGNYPLASVPIGDSAKLNVPASLTVDITQNFAVYNKVPVNVSFHTSSGVVLYVGRAAP
jgi:hypothetical protein